MYSASPKAKRIEFRPPDPSANPYLAFAAMMMAGLEGVLNKIDPGESLDKDIYDLSPEEMKNVPSMPGSLEDALNCLEDDHGFLLKGDVFTEELVETYIGYKRRAEADDIRCLRHRHHSGKSHSDRQRDDGGGTRQKTGWHDASSRSDPRPPCKNRAAMYRREALIPACADRRSPTGR